MGGVVNDPIPREQLPLDPAAFPPVTSALRVQARLRLGLLPGDPVFVSPAGVAHAKNQLGLVVAFGLARRSGGLHQGARLLLPGRPRGGQPPVALERLITLLRLGRQVLMCEPGPDLVSLYHAADTLVVSAWSEGMARATLAAQLCGLPALITSHAGRGAGDVVRDEETGWVVPVGRVEAFAQAMVRVAALTPEARDEMGRRARQAMLVRVARADGSVSGASGRGRRARVRATGEPPGVPET
jgi:D-inositol-3-phosphate glycosyltransferase